MLRQRIRTFTDLLSPSLPSLPSEKKKVEQAVSVADLRALAHRRTPRFALDYVEGAAISESARDNNEAAFARRSLAPSVTSSVAGASVETSLFGTRHSLPVGVAPIGLTSLMRADAEPAGARAAASVGVPFALSTMGTTSLEDVASAAPAGTRWFQLYLRRDREKSLDLVRRAADAGYEALVLTVDTRVPGRRLRDEHNKLSMPPRLTVRTAAQSALHPAWLKDLLFHDAPAMKNFGPQEGNIAQVVGSLFDPALSLEDLDWLRSVWDGPLIVKGVLRPDDAATFVAHGADAVWLSNHGGRQLDRAVSPIDVVSDVRARLGDDVPVILDSGIRTGVDVVTALASGADFVFMGRAYLYGLMAGGELGARRALEIVGQEALNTMQLVGARSVTELRGHDIVPSVSRLA